MTFTRESPEFKRAMKAARHLSAHKTTRVANTYTRGVNWGGMPKGATLLAILNGEHQYGPPEPQQVAFDLATSPGASGEFNLSEDLVARATTEWLLFSSDPDLQTHSARQRMTRLASALADFWRTQ